MAEYGIEATQLSGPSMAGTQALSPVQTEYVNTNGALSNVIQAAGSIFEGAVKKMQKNVAQEAQDSVVGGYIKTENQIADALKTGQINASAAASRSRANFSQYAAANPQYVKELKQAGDSLKGFGELGETERIVSEANDQRKKNISEASQRGFVFPENAPQQVVDAQIASYQASVRADETTRRMIQQNQESRAAAAEGRAVSAEARTLEDRTRKDMSLQIINELSGTNMNSFSVLGKSLVDDVTAGKRTLESAQQLLTQQFSHIQAGIQSAAGSNPELANGYRTTFQDMFSLFNKQLDPKTRAESIETEYNAILARNKLAAVSDPQFAAGVAVSQLLGNNPLISLQIQPATVNAVARTQDMANMNDPRAPKIVGEPQVEKETLNVLKSAISKLDSPNISQRDKMSVQAGNVTNVVLKQTGDLLGKGVDPASLKDLASFFSSSEYGRISTSGKLDPQAAQTAKKVFQLTYEPAVIKGVQEKLGNYLYSSSASFTGAMGAPKALSENIQVAFNGSGVSFQPKFAEGLSTTERASAQEQIASLNSSAKAINQLIHIGAHMEGSTDYQKYWEANKHIYMPQLYSRYQGLDIGTIKDGYRYTGGNVNDSKNWTKVDGAGGN